MEEKKSPHVIVIMADQLRFDVLSKEVAPNISQLRRESVQFSNAYCNSPLCVPARGSFFTSTYPNANGCLINPWKEEDASHGRSSNDLPNLYELMEDDWDSWHTGKQHFFTEDSIDERESSKTKWMSIEKGYAAYREELGKRAPGGPGFRGVLPEMIGGEKSFPTLYSIPTTGCYEGGFDAFFDGYILKESLNALKNRDKSKPLLLNAMFLAPHPPLEIPEPYFSKFKGVELPENVAQWSKGQSPLQMYNLTGYFGTRYSKEDWEKIWPVYLGLVNLLDDCVGQIVDELKAQGMYDESIIVFTSDHGEMLGSHCLWQKMCLYEESVRVPLYFKLPEGQHAGRSINETVMHIDVLPTICDLVDIPQKGSFQGKSLKGLINGGEVDQDRAAFVQFDGNGARGNFQRCVVQSQKKLIVDIFKDETFFELYDLKSDSQEMNNLAFEEKEEVEKLFALLREHMKETNDLLEIEEGRYGEFLQDYVRLKESESIGL